ncbi:MAG: TRAP transporter small permease [Caldisericaceae bacterium]
MMKSEMKKKRKFEIDELIMGSLLFIMAVIAFLNVLGRYVFHYSLAFTEEIGVNFFVWVTVIGMGVAFERGSHLGMVTLFRKFSKPVKKYIIWLNLALSVFLIGVVDLFVLRTIYEELTLFHSTSPALDIQMWIYYMGIPIFSIFVFIRMIRGHKKSLAKLEEVAK